MLGKCIIFTLSVRLFECHPFFFFLDDEEAFQNFLSVVTDKQKFTMCLNGWLLVKKA